MITPYQLACLSLLLSACLMPPIFAGKVQAFTGKEVDFSRYKTSLLDQEALQVLVYPQSRTFGDAIITVRSRRAATDGKEAIGQASAAGTQDRAAAA
jgi:hypothetical protein